MNKKANRVLSMVLTVLMLISMVSVFVLPASAATDDNLEYAKQLLKPLDYESILEEAYIVAPNYQTGDTQIFFGGQLRDLPEGKSVYTTFADAKAAADEAGETITTLVLGPGKISDLITVDLGAKIYGAYAGVSPNDPAFEKNLANVKEQGLWPANPSRDGATNETTFNNINFTNSESDTPYYVVDGITLNTYITGSHTANEVITGYVVNCINTGNYPFNIEGTVVQHDIVAANFRHTTATNQLSRQKTLRSFILYNSQFSLSNNFNNWFKYADASGTPLDYIKFGVYDSVMTRVSGNTNAYISTANIDILKSVDITFDNSIIYNLYKNNGSSIYLTATAMSSGSTVTVNFTNNVIYNDDATASFVGINISKSNYTINAENNMFIGGDAPIRNVGTALTAEQFENGTVAINANNNFYSSAVDAAGQEVVLGGHGAAEGAEDYVDWDYYSDTAMTTLVHKLVDVEGKEATCEEDGYTAHKACKNCDYIEGKETIPAGHTEGEAVVENKTDATCENAGSYDEVVYCTVCGEELSRNTVTVDKLPHTEVIDEAVAPTCTEAGLTEGKHCEVCGEVIVAQTVLEKLGHTEGEAVVENKTDATCEAAGSYDEVVYCTVCGEELSRKTVTVDKLPHTEVIDEAVAPTCTETGLTEGKHCEVCGEVIVAQTVVESLGHTEGEVVVENEAKADCVNNGSYDNVVYCTVCGVELSRETITVDALGHNYESVVTIEPTLESEGEMTYTCTVCGDSYTESIPALTLPVLSLNEDGNVVLTTSITVTKIYYGSIGENVPAESAKYPWNEFVSLTADTRKTDFKPLDGDVYKLTEDGNYYFAVVYTVDGVNKTDYKVFMSNGDTAIVHTEAAAIVENEIAATCDAAGSYDNVVYCKDCGVELKRETITVDALGHDYEMEITTEPTNDAEGLKTFTCKTCGDSFTEVLDKLGMPRIKENGKLSENGVDVIKVYYGFIGSNVPTQMNADKAWKKWDEFTALTAAGRTSDFAPVDGEKYALTEDGNYYFAIVYKDANGAQKTTYSVVNSASVESDKPTVTVENGVATLSTNNLKVTKLYWGFMDESTATDWDTFKAEAQDFTSDFKPLDGEEYTLTKEGNYCLYIIYEEECVQTAVAYSVSNK